MTRAAVRVLLGLLAREPEPELASRAADPAVVEAAARLGVLPILAGVAVRLGRLPDAADTVAATLGDRRSGLSPGAALLAARYDNRKRQEDLALLEARTVRLLHPFRLVPLKGAALRAHSVWPYDLERPQRDIDLWCPERSAASLAHFHLRRNGYVAAKEQQKRQAWTDDHHDDALVVEGLSGSVEIHRNPLAEHARWAAYYPLLNTPDGVELTPTALILHVILHAQLQDSAFALRRLPIVALLDVAYALESSFVTAEQLRSAAAGIGVERAVEYHLYCVERLRGRTSGANRSMERRWRWAVLFLAMPRLAILQQELFLSAQALSRRRMELRAGRSLRPVPLLLLRAQVVMSRGARAARRVASQP
jgi:hypothetical protein